MISKYDSMFWDDAEAKARKAANGTYTTWSYDSDRALNDFTKAKEKIEDIKQDIAEIGNDFSNLKALYEEFTGYNESMDNAFSQLNQSVEAVSSYMNQVFNDALEDVNARAQEDKALVTEIGRLSEMLSNTVEND